MRGFDLPAVHASSVHQESVVSGRSRAAIALSLDPSDEYGPLPKASGPDAIDPPSRHCQRGGSEWTESEIIRLQFILLDECRALANPVFPLAEKLDILRWIFAEDHQAMAAFSFYRCVRSVYGSCDLKALRAALREKVPLWLDQTLQQYPGDIRSWLADRLRRDPTWLADRLDSNPQFINETTRALKFQPDLFADLL